MTRNDESGAFDFKVMLPEDIDWKPFPAFPPGARLAVVVGHPAEPGPYVVRVKVPDGTKLMPLSIRKIASTPSCRVFSTSGSAGPPTATR
jgi:hypothetical protein